VAGYVKSERKDSTTKGWLTARKGALKGIGVSRAFCPSSKGTAGPFGRGQQMHLQGYEAQKKKPGRIIVSTHVKRDKPKASWGGDNIIVLESSTQDSPRVFTQVGNKKM